MQSISLPAIPWRHQAVKRFSIIAFRFERRVSLRSTPEKHTLNLDILVFMVLHLACTKLPSGPLLSCVYNVFFVQIVIYRIVQNKLFVHRLAIRLGTDSRTLRSSLAIILIAALHGGPLDGPKPGVHQKSA